MSWKKHLLFSRKLWVFRIPLMYPFAINFSQKNIVKEKNLENWIIIENKTDRKHRDSKTDSVYVLSVNKMESVTSLKPPSTCYKALFNIRRYRYWNCWSRGTGWPFLIVALNKSLIVENPKTQKKLDSSYTEKLNSISNLLSYVNLRKTNLLFKQWVAYFTIYKKYNIFKCCSMKIMQHRKNFTDENA